MPEHEWYHSDCDHPSCELGKRALTLVEREGVLTKDQNNIPRGKSVFLPGSPVSVAIVQVINTHVTARGIEPDANSTSVMTITPDYQVSSGADHEVLCVLEILRRYMVLGDLADA